MSDLNHALFEEYKRLDKLCGDLYGDQHGVSRYIDDMKDVSGSDYLYVPNWKGDLEQLIRLRHIRNHLAHTEGAFDEEICTPKDIDWSREFYSRILKQADPLALLNQYIKSKQQRRKGERWARPSQIPPSSVQYDVANKYTEERSTDNDGEMDNRWWAVLLLAIVAGLFLVWFGITVLGY